MCEDEGPMHHGMQGMPFLRHLLQGIPMSCCEDGPDMPFPPGPHAVKKEGDQQEVLIPVPGFGKEEVDLEVKGRFLKVTGHKKGAEVPKEKPAPEPEKAPEPEGPEGCCEGPHHGHGFRGFPFPRMHYWAQDTFQFYVPIPPGADADGEVKARVEKGLLHVTFQKRPEKKLPVE
jgi:HSP20 family molecular chaperone IbpA